MELSITGNTEVVLVEEKKVTINKLTIQRMVDLPGQKKVVCFVKEIPTPIILWEGDTYDSIGQWTDVNVLARLRQIYGI